jgi:L-alanine-DL-glutamate epimerase-like enolase superfamily enzyme
MNQNRQGWSRRSFLRDSSVSLIAGAAGLGASSGLAEAAGRVRTKITDLQSMEIVGAGGGLGTGGTRTYVFVKILTDGGVYGIAEGYGRPNVGLREQVAALKPKLVGRDPLEIDKIYTFLGEGLPSLSGTFTDGSAHAQMNLASVIDMALWDLAGKLLNVPTTILLGGKFREHVRVYDHSGPKDMLDKNSCREWAAKANAHPSGFTAHKFGPQRTAVAFSQSKRGLPDANHDPSNRELTTKELISIAQGFENAREAIGWDHDIMVHLHWELNLSTSIQLAKALAHIKPLWLEDPLQVDYSDSWKRLVEESPIPILCGENLERRQGFMPFLTNQAVDLIQPDLRNSGGFLETKRIADMASLYGIPVCNHNTGTPVNTIQTCQWAGAIRDYVACETDTGEGGWFDNIVQHDGPYIEKGYLKITDRPGTGVELNREIVEAHLVPGSTWWGGA